MTEKISVDDLSVDQLDGRPMKITANQNESSNWESSVEVDLGKTGRVVFENTNQTYGSEEEAREAVLALAVQNLSRSRVGKNHN